MKGNQGLEALAALCGGASKAKMKDENALTAASSSMMPPPPAVCIASSKGLAPNGLAPSPTAPASAFPAGNNSGVPVAAPSPVSPFPVMADLSSPQWQQALFAASLANGAPMPSPAAAIATAPSPSLAPTPSPAAAVSALLSAGLPQQFMDPAFQQLAAYFPHYQFIQAQAHAQAHAQAQAQAAQAQQAMRAHAPPTHAYQITQAPATPTPAPAQIIPIPQTPTPAAAAPTTPASLYTTLAASQHMRPPPPPPAPVSAPAPQPQATPMPVAPQRPQQPPPPPPPESSPLLPPIPSPATGNVETYSVVEPSSVPPTTSPNLAVVSPLVPAPVVAAAANTGQHEPHERVVMVEENQQSHVVSASQSVRGARQQIPLIPLEPSKSRQSVLQGYNSAGENEPNSPQIVQQVVQQEQYQQAVQQQSMEEDDVSSQPTGPAGPLAAAGGEATVLDKKQLKRAANRRSAQLSRKRKKQFIEELKEENDELRRKEQILRSIPDLIVVFDSAGRLWFVSHSVSRLLDYTPHELEAESFWDRLCDESVRLLKAAFMDALAAKSQGCDTAPLGNGVWELRLVDRDGSHKLVTLNGVVHFSGDSPECVCSIRPRDYTTSPTIHQNHQRISHIPPTSTSQPLPPKDSLPQLKKMKTINNSTTASTNNNNPLQNNYYNSHLFRNTIKPQQSVITNASSDDASVKITRGRAPAGQLLHTVTHPPPAAPSTSQVTSSSSSSSQTNQRPTNSSANNNHNNGTNHSRIQRAAQISDGDSSVVSESGSDP